MPKPDTYALRSTPAYYELTPHPNPIIPLPTIAPPSLLKICQEAAQVSLLSTDDLYSGLMPFLIQNGFGREGV
jgi:hypothetical protein